MATHFGPFFSFHSIGISYRRTVGAELGAKLLRDERCAGTRMMTCWSMTICHCGVSAGGGKGIAVAIGSGGAAGGGTSEVGAAAARSAKA
ncbi:MULTISPECIES: hypothetical protein [Sphingopyxis]|uniref:hypothetical protein n=1 Tax=Sphingopyxis TaxID=165697 RepID=UPI001D0AD9F6|nr:MULTISPECIES: hypothetical protein [Sphingopyxis]